MFFPPNVVNYSPIPFQIDYINNYQMIWEEGYLSEQAWEIWISSIWKGDNRLLPVNSRLIALSNHLSKTFEGILKEAILSTWI